MEAFSIGTVEKEFVFYGQASSLTKILIYDLPVHRGKHISVIGRTRITNIVVPGLI